MLESKDIVKNREEQHEINNTERTITPLANIYETEDNYVLTAELPGVNKDNLSVSLDNQILVIEGRIESHVMDTNPTYSEYEPANYYRSFKVGNSIDREKIHATMKNGVLTLTLHKAAEAKPRKIEVKGE